MKMKEGNLGERMIGIRVSIARHISDDPQPGIVECEIVDAHGHRHSFIEKTAIVTAEMIDSSSAYPRAGVIACTIIDRRQNESGREIIVIDTQSPWNVESTEGLMQFEVTSASLVEWERGSDVQHPWNGT